MHHLEFAALESASLQSDARWEAWVARAEKILGFDLNGCIATDGYSLDTAYGAFQARRTATDYAREVQAVRRSLTKAA